MTTDEGRGGDHAEHVDPGTDVGRLPIRQQVLGRKPPDEELAQRRGPASRNGAVGGLLGVHCGLAPVVVARERQHERGHEDHDHAGDQDQVRDRDHDEAPVQVGRGIVHTDTLLTL